MGHRSLKAHGIGHITSILADHNLTHAALAQAIGVSPSTVTEWINKGEAPRWSLLAVECLRRRQGKDTSHVMLIKVPTGKREMVETFLTALNVTAAEIRGFE